VLAAGETTDDPMTATFPTPLSMVTEVAPAVFQERVACSPGAIVTGLDENDNMASFCAAGAEAVNLELTPPIMEEIQLQFSPTAIAAPARTRMSNTPRMIKIGDFELVSASGMEPAPDCPYC
jgi:hypothetical protein